MLVNFQVHFEGVMLFVIYHDRVEVLIPDTSSGLYADGRPGARPHQAWMTSPRPGHLAHQYPVRARLEGSDLSIAAGPTAGAPNTTSLVTQVLAIDDTLPAPNRLVTNLRPSRAVAIITLRGGAFSAPVVDSGSHSLTLAGRPAPIVISPAARTIAWSCDYDCTPFDSGPEIAGTAGDAGIPRRLSEFSSPLVISNLDVATPELWQPDYQAYSAGTPDLDFQLVYSLFDPPTLQASALVGGALPHPILGTGVSPSGAKCKGALIHA